MKTSLLIGILLCSVAQLFALVGYGTSTPDEFDTLNPSLSILSPNGGESWYIGDTNDIIWDAFDSHLSPNCINLWYSLDGGAYYISIAEGIANSGSLAWEMPAIQSYNAKVRIKASDSFGNYNQIASASPFSITFVPPKPPAAVNVNTANGIDAVITWQAVTQNIYNTPITPDGYIILFNETPYEDDQFYYFLGRSFGLTYTHHDVAAFRDQMFYKVLAYIDYRGAMEDIVQMALSNPEQRLSLAEINALLHNYPNGGEK